MSPSLPKTFKAAVVTSAGGNFEIIEKPLEAPKAGTILVKVLACGVCASDGMVKMGIVPLPRIPGHEIVGDVVSVPAGESRWKVGDRVGSGWHGGHCHECSSCEESDFITCSKKAINGVSQDGGYAEYVLLRTEAVVSVPTELDPAEAAPLFCAGVTTFNSLRHVHGLKKGDVVAIHGLGGLGHLGIQYAKKMGYKVVALSQSGSKKELATKLGADIYLDGSKVDHVEELLKLGGAKVILATAPNGDAITTLLGGLKPGGTMLTVAIADLKLSSVTLISKRLSIMGFPAGDANDCADAIEFAQTSNVKTMIERFPLEKANEAFNRMHSGQANFRAVLIP
ncbi:GroES-like protein [Gymnopus androsaceus JB14]|uniref:GroES-like protein n=1 Tax=Gymnopus androsaceus JB14 TaxID=1447944 RepID=A0A6A4HA52_9AGAR|nr:GroES-like protein [Gymnopus androsaceus JB14]